VGKVVQFELPVPPSVNNYYVRGYRNTVRIGKAGKAYRQAVVAALRPLDLRVSGCLDVSIVYCAASTSSRALKDLDNLLKCLLDSLTHAGLWEDDSQIDRLLVERGPIKAPGFVSLTVREM
jgi:crossover junction endodeoxyribonuclease RusA